MNNSMIDDFLYKAKIMDTGEWIEGFVIKKQEFFYLYETLPSGSIGQNIYEIIPATICQYTGLKDSSGNKIWENDILMRNQDPNDLYKIVFGEFDVINTDNLKVVTKVIGWHCRVLKTDGSNECIPFCLHIPLSKRFIKRAILEVVGNTINRSNSEK